ncbi:MAG: aspartate aminotransferase family protein [Chloroflexi bacterium]|nr:aspartate aminotransferase family protein [Chloroflexota bacterium]
MHPRKPQSPQEKALLEKARRYLPGATLGNAPSNYDDGFLVQGGRGAKVWDFSGNEYIDYLLGSGPMLLGHAHPAVVEAVRSQLDQGSTFFLTNGAIVQLAEEVCKAVPCADMVRFTTSGTDATFQAMRAARAYRKRDVVLKFEGGFHGSSDYALQSVTPARLVDFPTPLAGSAGIPKAIQDTMLIAPFNDLDATASIITKRHDELAAVIVEPMQRILPPAPGFLQGLREVTARYGIPLIFDEVVTGFRFAYGGAQEYYGVTPDLAALGKVIGGGYPLAAVCGRADIMRAYDAGAVAGGDFIPQTGTLNGNPVAAVAGLATLAELRKPGVYQRLHDAGSRLRTALQQTLDQAEIPARVCGEDTVFDVYFTEAPITTYRSTLSANGAMLRRFNRLLLERGILKGGQKFYLSLAHTDQDLDQTIAAIRDAAEHLRGT